MGFEETEGEEVKVKFGYGALCNSLEEQANKQGFTLKDKAEGLEQAREAISVLMFKDVLTPSQVNKAVERLNKNVIKALEKIPVVEV